MTIVHPPEDAQLVSATTLTGQPLLDNKGAKLGVIKDIFVNRVTGQVEFVIGATGGLLGVGEKFHPLPWSALAYNATPEGYVVSVGKEAIRAAPPMTATSSRAPATVGGPRCTAISPA